MNACWTVTCWSMAKPMRSASGSCAMSWFASSESVKYSASGTFRMVDADGYPGRMAALDVLSPKTRTWFERAFEGPTPAQELGWPAIAAGGHVLIQAPTGSGKTLAAFLLGLDRLNESPGEGLRLLYVSPLKALNYDIERNLRSPLAGLESKLRVGVRTGDTPAEERRRMLRTPPDILITTPGVALPAPHLAGAGDAARCRDGDPRRGARRRGDEARRPPRALARAARAPGRGAVPARRALRDAAADGGDRALRRRHRTPDTARRRRDPEGAGPPGRRPRRGHARARVDVGALRASARRRRRRWASAWSSRAGRSGPRSTRRSSSSCGSTARRSSSSTTGGWRSGSRSASTSSRKRSSRARTTARSRASSGSWSRSC